MLDELARNEDESRELRREAGPEEPEHLRGEGVLSLHVLDPRLGRVGKDAMREFKYYRSNAGGMKYDEYRANEWFIGPGVIESGCKSVIGQRHAGHVSQ